MNKMNPLSSAAPTRYIPALFGPAVLCAALWLAGCRSRFVEASIENTGSHPLHVIEVDYPSASFGTNAIAPNSQFHYRFKILGSGSVKISFTDDAGKAHASTGPELDEGQEGSLHITVKEDGSVGWDSMLRQP